MFLYGINPAFETIRAGRRAIHRAYINQEADNNPRLKKLVQFLRSKQISTEFTNKGKLFDLCQTREHQGVVLDAEAFPHTPFADMIGSPRMVLLDSIEDPHNEGAIMRSAEIFGWNNILLPRRGVPLLLPSVIKASAGACEHLQIAVNCSANQYCKIAKDEGYTIVALDGGGKTSLEDLRAQRIEKLLLVVGGENAGVSQFILNMADHVAAITQKGKINSLNASVAAGLALYLLA